MGTVFAVALTTFLASAVEAVEMVAIVTGVGATRGWRSALAGTAAGFAVLIVVVAVFGVALTAIPIELLRLVVGALLLVFGLNWLRKGLRRVAAYGLRGRPLGEIAESDEQVSPGKVDWTGFVLTFKGVLLEGLEVAFIVVTFGVAGRQLGVAALGGVVAVVLVGAIGIMIQPAVRRIPRSVLQLIVGLLLTTFGTFWAVEGLGIEWPASDATILLLLLFYGALSAAYISVQGGFRARQAERAATS